VSVTVITPTADQPIGIALLERWMRRQTVQPSQWIVADDGLAPAELSLGQEHLVRERAHEGGRSLAANLLAAIKVARGERILIMEHDDYYAPDHIAVQLDHLGDHVATGARRIRYYNVAARGFKVMRNTGSALCNTALTREALPQLRAAAERCLGTGEIGVDGLFWSAVRGQVHDVDTVVGIKALPGRQGLGVGHRHLGWQLDPELEQLRAWIGEDVEHYAHL
jgi:glycosyltransferase involved in cell wall biosynthesis